MSLPDPTVTGVPETGPLISPVFGTGATEIPLLEVRQLSVAYATDKAPVVAVDRVDLEVRSGEFLAVVGESGCGKSTLLYAIAQLLNPPAGVIGGSVKFHGSEMVDMTDRRLRHIRWRELSVVMQSAMNALNPVMTVAEQMRDACRAHSDMSDEAIAERSREMFRLVSIDPAHLDSYPHQLSGGMRQRAMIAMALLFTPQLVVMDEPTSALDVVAQRSLMRQIKELQQQLGFAVIFVTHDVSLIHQFSDRLMVMYAGQVAELGPTRRLFGAPKHPYSRGLLEAYPSIRGPKVPLIGIPGSPPDLGAPPSGCRFQPRCSQAMSECATIPPELYESEGMVVRCLLYDGSPRPSNGSTVSPSPPAPPSGIGAVDLVEVLPEGVIPPAANGQVSIGNGQAPSASASPPLLAVEGLSMHFPIGGTFSRKRLHAVDDATFVVNPQEIVALVGESGSGKSTLVRLIATVYRPTSGEINFAGRPLSSMRGRRTRLAYRGEVPMVFQDPYSSINPAFRVSHGIMRAMKLHRPDLDRAGRRREAIRVMETVGLTPPEVALAKFPYELSGGQRQRIGFAQALALRPKLILADEPVSMLDVSIRVGLLNVMAKLRRDEGVSILYVTHDLASARYVADRVLVMYAGHIVEQGATEKILADPRHPYTQLLLSAAPDPHAPVEAKVASADAGEPPKVIDPAPGCRFAPRCPYVIERCRTETPVLGEVAPGQLAACHVAIDRARASAPAS